MSRAQEELSDLEAQAKAGDRVAQRRFGNFWKSQGNRSEAIKWWRQAADQGDRKAQQIMYRILKEKDKKQTKRIDGFYSGLNSADVDFSSVPAGAAPRGGEDLSSSLILGSVVGAISGLILGLIFGLIFSAVLKFMFIGAVLLGIAGAVWGFVAYVNGW